MSEPQFDVIVIGSGPGGYVAAIRAAQLGFRTAIVEREHIGGICLNWGCIPTKALLRTAEIYQYVKHAGDYGLTVGKVGIDAAAIIGRSRAVAGRLNRGVSFLLGKNKVTIIWGEARISKPGEIVVTSPTKAPMQPQVPAAKGALGPGTYRGTHIIVATGARPRALAGLEADGKLIWTYFEAMVPSAMPKSLLVVGSGAIGIEFASFFNAMGSEVTVVEILDQILPAEDVEIAKLARQQLEKHGIRIETGAKVSELKKGEGNVTATIEQGGERSTITAERVISAVGVVGNIENLGLEALGVRIENGSIRDGRVRLHQCGGRLRDRRCGRPTHARPQGGTRRRHLRGIHQRPEAPRHEQAADTGLHLLPPTDRIHRSDRG